VVSIHTTGAVENAFKHEGNDLFSFIQFCFTGFIGAEQNQPFELFI